MIVCTKVHTITSLFIHSIFKCRINSLNSNCEYLISYIEPGFNTRWIDSSIIDEDDYYYDVLVKFNESTSNEPGIGRRQCNNISCIILTILGPHIIFHAPYINTLT